MPSDPTILTGAYALGVTLTTPNTTIAYLGLVQNTSGPAVNGPQGSVWTLTNYGTVAAPAGVGVYLYSGSLINAASGNITGYNGGFASDPGTLINAGSIGATGTHSYGVSFVADGSVTNTTSGTIASAYNGVLIGGAGTVINDGTISVAGSRGYGVSIGGIGSVVNTGTIEATGTYGIAVDLYTGGSVTNQTGGTISGRSGIAASYDATVVNAGFIGASGTTLGTLSAGVVVSNDSVVTNESSGTITGYYGISATYGVTVVNIGLVTGGDTAGAGVYLSHYSALTNQSGGRISGYYGVVVGYDSNAADPISTVVNAGNIAGDTTYGAGIYLVSAASVTNQTGGTITGSYGIQSRYAATIVNDGSIGGSGTYGHRHCPPTRRQRRQPGQRFDYRRGRGHRLLPRNRREWRDDRGQRHLRRNVGGSGRFALS
jgi:hypothetical protein